MHINSFVFLLALASSTTATASPNANPDALANPNPDANFNLEALSPDVALGVGVPLEKRACTYTGCACLKGIKPGVYCGNCYNPKDHNYWAVQKKGSSSRFATHAFQCAKSGDCCDYGVASDCGGTKARCVSPFVGGSRGD